MSDKNTYYGQAVLFADGANGYYRQEFDIVHGPEAIDVGVRMVVEGRRGEKPVRVFMAGGMPYENLKNAIEANGLRWVGEE